MIYGFIDRFLPSTLPGMSQQFLVKTVGLRPAVMNWAIPTSMVLVVVGATWFNGGMAYRLFCRPNSQYYWKWGWTTAFTGAVFFTPWGTLRQKLFQD